MTVKLYKMNASPASRTAMMGCEIFKVPVEMVDVQLLQGENKSPEFVKKNPGQTVPVLEDGDLIVNDSHAILQYVADAYGKDDSWYPKDVRKRALVNQILFFDTSILFPRLKNIAYPALYEGVRIPPQKTLDAIKEAYGFAEEFLSRSKFLASDKLTIADVSAFATISTSSIFVPISQETYPKLNAWFVAVQKQPFAKKYNETGLKEYKELFKQYVEGL